MGADDAAGPTGGKPARAHSTGGKPARDRRRERRKDERRKAMNTAAGSAAPPAGGSAAVGAAVPAEETGSGNLFSKRELQGAVYLPVDVGGRPHHGILLRGEVVVLRTAPFLFPVACRDCGRPFDADGNKRWRCREEGKSDPLSCYACRGHRRNAFYSARLSEKAPTSEWHHWDFENPPPCMETELLENYNNNA